jgi:hypothetical protein
MEQNNPSSKKNKEKLSAAAKKTLSFFARWFFMMALLAATVFCVFVWQRFLWKAAWSEDKKKSYISEQAQFSFNKEGYKKMVELMKNRRDKFQNYPYYKGRDVFFPENF